MFKNTFQSGFLSILYSIGSQPLQIWDKKVRNGHIKRITDIDIQSLVLEVEGTNVSTTYITCPADPKKTLGIKLPFLVMIIKNLKKYFTFEVQIHANCRIRRVYFSDRLYSEDELPAEFKLYLPVQNKAKPPCKLLLWKRYHIRILLMLLLSRLFNHLLTNQD
ncbi:upf0468 protein c16orf80-like protein isoform X3 [Ictalurus punctatus]|uniref:Upf0468 protein c16orf80-like protein isoform X3 n=1 Tax=Ictalurus punctatus TaxID=7998 RepID=A0A2D0SX72_ICTPU|nr:upf0468 protein c16orf80-like protein isoform X3 [Ictalurus punctatus]